MQSIFWHDYETFGIDTKRDRPSQFAGIRTDLDLNIIDEPITLYCKPAEDSLPSPDACLVTGITPQLAQAEGVSEADFTRIIHKAFSQANTCVAGYNSIRFDDEVSRNLFYRNFYDPYEREWKDGNSRWDIIDVVRLTYALRPDGIVWPLDDSGKPSFRLEKLTEANNIEHASAHDAMSDVYATIGIAKLIKEKQPQLFNYIFEHRSKRSLLYLFDTKQLKPVLHISSKYPVNFGCSALVVPLFKHPTNTNGFVVFDLRQNPEDIQKMSVETIRNRLYTSTANLLDNEIRPALKTIHINKCPMVVPASMAKTISPDNLKKWQLDLNNIQKNLEWIRLHPEFLAKIMEVFNTTYEGDVVNDPDLMIYSGGFFSANDKTVMTQVREASEVELAETEFQFQDTRLTEMLFRYKARNFPATLTDEEQSIWGQHCANKLLDDKSSYLTFNRFFARLNELAQSEKTNPKDQALLQDLRYYAESIIPYS